jgi:hypothetical protein
MSNAVTLRELSKLAQKLNDTPGRLGKALDMATKEIRGLVTQQFSTHSNPWGRPWAPQRVKTNPVLVRSGDLVDSIRIDHVGNAIVTKVGAPYARYLQRGRRVFKKGAAGAIAARELSRGASKHKLLRNKDLSRVGMKPRTIIPFKKLPPTWELAIAQSLAEELSK